MPIITFNIQWREKLIDGSKRQTIRKNATHWVKQWESAFEHNRALVVWCPTPRYGKGVLLGKVWEWSVQQMHGVRFDDDLAQRDGFGTARELIAWLMEHNEMTHNEVMEHSWAVIRWEKLEVAP